MARGMSQADFWDAYAANPDVRLRLRTIGNFEYNLPVSEFKDADLKFWGEAQDRLREMLRWFRAPLQLARVAGRRPASARPWLTQAAVGGYWERMRQAQRWVRGEMPASVSEYLEAIGTGRRQARAAQPAAEATP